MLTCIIFKTIIFQTNLGIRTTIEQIVDWNLNTVSRIYWVKILEKYMIVGKINKNLRQIGLCYIRGKSCQTQKFWNYSESNIATSYMQLNILCWMYLRAIKQSGEVTSAQISSHITTLQWRIFNLEHFIDHHQVQCALSIRWDLPYIW